MDGTGNVVWLASYPKSGNTWIRLFLASYRAHGAPIDLNSLPAELTLADMRDRDYHAVSPYPVERLGSLEVLMLRQAAILHAIASVSEGPFLIKTHSANAVLSGVRLFLPPLTSGSIYIARDPRDVAVSYAEWTGASIDEIIDLIEFDQTMIHGANDASRPIFSFLGNWSAHVKSWIDDPAVKPLLVRYEDLLQDPHANFSKIVEKIGWKVDPGRVDRAIRSTDFMTLSTAERMYGFREAIGEGGQFFKRGSSGGWSGSLTKEQSGRIEEAHGEMMERLGYPLS